VNDKDGRSDSLDIIPTILPLHLCIFVQPSRITAFLLINVRLMIYNIVSAWSAIGHK